MLPLGEHEGECEQKAGVRRDESLGVELSLKVESLQQASGASVLPGRFWEHQLRATVTFLSDRSVGFYLQRNGPGKVCSLLLLCPACPHFVDVLWSQAEHWLGSKSESLSALTPSAETRNLNQGLWVYWAAQRTVIEIYSQHVANWIKAPFPVTILQGIDHRWRSEWLQSIRHFLKSLMDTIRVTVTRRGVICPLKFVMNKPKDALSQYASMLMQPGRFSSSQIVFKRLLVTQFPPDFHACYSPWFLLFYWDLFASQNACLLLIASRGQLSQCGHRMWWQMDLSLIEHSAWWVLSYSVSYCFFFSFFVPYLHDFHPLTMLPLLSLSLLSGQFLSYLSKCSLCELCRN